MPIHRGEDKPLLVSIFEGRGCANKGSDDEAYSETKYGKPPAMKRWKELDYGGQNRAKGFMLGAMSVIKRWPDQYTILWIIAVAFCFMITLAIFVMVSFKSGTHHPFSTMNLQQKCMIRHKEILKSSKSEYPEKTNVYLHVTLNDDETFNIDKYDSAFSSLGQNHPNHIINVYVLHNDTKELDYKRNTRFKDWEVYHNQFDQPDFFDTSSAEEDNAHMTEIKNRNIGQTDYQNIKVIRSTFSNYFKHSPLRYRWRLIPPEMLPFVFRVLSLWEHGGITMPWQLFLDKTDIFCVVKDGNDQFKDLVKDLKNNFPLLEKTTVFTPLDTQLLIEDIQRFVDIRGNDMEFIDEDIEETTTKIVRTTTKADILEETVIRSKTPEDLNSPTVIASEEIVDESSESAPPPAKQRNRPSPPTSSEVQEEMERLAKKLEMKSKTVAEVDVETVIDPPTREEPETKKRKIMDPVPLDEYVDDTRYETMIQPKESILSQEVIPRKKPKGSVEKMKKLEEVNKEQQRVEEKMNQREREKNNAREKDVKKRTKRDLTNIVVDLLTGASESLDNGLPDSLIDYSGSFGIMGESDEYESYSDSYSGSNSGSYSGFNSPKVYKTNLGRNLNELRRQLSTSSEYSTSDAMIEPTLRDLSRSVSDYEKTNDYFREKEAYVEHSIFQNMNVFAIPTKANLVLDRFGYYYSAKKPCHAFLGHLISGLQSDFELKDVESFVEGGLRSFCRGSKYKDCSGISLL